MEWLSAVTPRIKKTVPNPTLLKWKRFTTLTAARDVFRSTPCIYVQTDSSALPIRVGKASLGLEPRYRGGTGYALDAAMHGSGNFVFVAEVPSKECESIERELIWQHREALAYNNVGKRAPPSVRVTLIHEGDAPKFKDEI